MSLILYAYCNPDNIPHQTQCGELPGTPFYIGIGKSGRHLDHLKLAKGSKQDTVNAKKTQHIRQLINCNTLPLIVVLKERLMLDEAKLLEKSIIAEIGTESPVKYVEKRGTLLNLHYGGGGGVGSKKPKSEETRKKISVSMKKIIKTPEQIAAFIAAGANRIRSAEENARRGKSISKTLSNRPPEEVALQMEKRRAKGWVSEEAKTVRATRAANGDFKHSEDTKKKIAKLTAEAMADKAVKAKMVASSEKRWANDEERKKVAERNSKTFQLTNRETGEMLVIKNMQAFCRQTGSHPRKVLKEFEVSALL
jgi:AAA+ superfamily predicted ATPase